MLQDLHAHTYYSFCGGDAPEEVVKAAIAGGLHLFGFTDHSYGILYQSLSFFNLPENIEVQPDCIRTLRRYYDHINLIREAYKDQITILRGIEVCTWTGHGRHALPPEADISYFDYCLMENLDNPDSSIAGGDLFAFAERCGCKLGIAHTDLFAFIKALGEDPLSYLMKMKEHGIFWELNISHDSIHHYREHPYMLHFFEDEEQQALVRRSGVEISIGFDGHRVAEYPGDRVKCYCRRAEELGLRFAFEYLI